MDPHPHAVMTSEPTQVYICIKCDAHNTFVSNEPLICSACRDSRIFKKEKCRTPVLYKAR